MGRTRSRGFGRGIDGIVSGRGAASFFKKDFTNDKQKITSGIDLEHVYSKDIKAIKVIYTIIQITHLILQIIEHSNICGEFNKKYGSVKVFRRKFYAHLTETYINIELIQIKIQIRFDKSLMTY